MAEFTNRIKYYDIKNLSIYHDYFDEERYKICPSFNKYIGIRIANKRNIICAEDDSYKIGYFDNNTKQFEYIQSPLCKKPIKCIKDFGVDYAYGYENGHVKLNLDLEETLSTNLNPNSNPDFIITPSDYFMKCRKDNYKIDLNFMSECEHIFLSSNKIEEYEQKLSEMHDETLLKYSLIINKLAKQDENKFRFVCVMNKNKHELDWTSEITNKIEHIYDLMSEKEHEDELVIPNDFVSILVKINSVSKSNHYEFGVDFEGTICTYNYQNNSGNLDCDLIEIGNRVKFTTNTFTKLLNRNVNDIVITESLVDFSDVNTEMILMKENIYKDAFLEFIYERYN